MELQTGEIPGDICKYNLRLGIREIIRRMADIIPLPTHYFLLNLVGVGLVKTVTDFLYGHVIEPLSVQE